MAHIANLRPSHIARDAHDSRGYTHNGGQDIGARRQPLEIARDISEVDPRAHRPVRQTPHLMAVVEQTLGDVILTATVR
jgi:hypothetical protein